MNPCNCWICKDRFIKQDILSAIVHGCDFSDNEGRWVGRESPNEKDWFGTPYVQHDRVFVDSPDGKVYELLLVEVIK